MQDIKKHKSVSNQLKSTKFLKWSVLLFFGVLILATWQCASIQRPTGGPKDSIPPKILLETPVNLTRNFDQKEIIIEFDEFIKLVNDFQEISMSPEMPSRPEFKVRRKNLVITLPDSLEENTTYTINFGKAIVDVNEGNPLGNYMYVFATGDIIDSLSISGNVKNAFTKEIEKEVTVMLIPTSQDSIFGKKKPNIFTRTDTSGNFKLNYLREDTYRIYALKEDNNDRIYNGPTEQIGFLADSIYLDTALSDINLEIFQQTPTDFRVMNRTIEKDGKIAFVFNRPIENGNIEILQPNELNTGKIVEIRPTKDSINMWLSELTFDSLKVHFIEQDTVLDTVDIRRGKNDKYERDFMILDNLEKNKVNKVKHLVLSSTSPVAQIDRNKLILTEDSVARTNYQLVADTINPRHYILRFNWKAKRNYGLEIQEGAFIGHFEDKNKEHKIAFTLDDTDSYGDILFHVEVPDTGKNYIVELIDEKKERLFRKIAINKSQELPFRQLKEGKYTIRVIYDENGNNKWDPGDVYEKRQPERIWYNGTTFIIRPNWEQSDKIIIPK